MSKELVISVASHERSVAILEQGQLVEIYIEREKEFALVGSIYKGKVTRVLPGMQSAFVDIGLDGDAFLYVSDVFENLEDYDSGHPHEQPQASVASPSPANGSPVEVLPGESLARAAEHHEEARHVTIPRRAIPPVVLTTARARILAAAVTAAGIAAAVAVGDAVADATAADARSRLVRAGATCLPRNMHRRKEANPADMKIAVDSRAVTTTGVRKLREAPRLR